jgi:hypothetical protein
MWFFRHTTELVFTEQILQISYWIYENAIHYTMLYYCISFWGKLGCLTVGELRGMPENYRWAMNSEKKIKKYTYAYI